MVSGDVYIDGDLLIKGEYKGIGTIYVTGNVYIPANLKAQNSVFPYPEDKESALSKAQSYALDKSKTALGSRPTNPSS